MASKGDEIGGNDRFGFYSETHASMGRVVLYEDESGKTVRVTGVSSYRDPAWYGWKDRQPLGRLVKFIGLENPKEPKPSGVLADHPVVRPVRRGKKS